jgi:hypothetical protein
LASVGTWVFSFLQPAAKIISNKAIAGIDNLGKVFIYKV